MGEPASSVSEAPAARVTLPHLQPCRRAIKAGGFWDIDEELAMRLRLKVHI